MKLTGMTAGFTSARKAFPAGSDGEFRDVLFDTLLKTLRRATTVPTITVAHKKVNEIASLMGRQHIFLRSWQELSGCENNTWFDGKIAAKLGCRTDLPFEPR